MANPSSLPSPVSVPDLPVVPLRDLAPWAIFVVVLSFALLYLVGAEQGATAVVAGEWVHEFVHDGRHLLGFPCH